MNHATTEREDIRSPDNPIGMDGIEFLRHARLRTRARIVVLSSVAGAGAPRALEARRLGADAVLQKPSGSVSVDVGGSLGEDLLKTLERICP